MTLINTVHQLGSSNAVVNTATEIRSVLSMLRQMYRANIGQAGIELLHPPLPMYHAWPHDIPRTMEFPVVIARLANAMDGLGQVSI